MILQIILKFPIYELYFPSVLATFGDNKNSCLFEQRGGSRVGGGFKQKKISYQSPWSPCLMMMSSLLNVTCPQFRIISFKYSEMMKTFQIKYRRSHKINSHEIKRAELHVLVCKRKKTFNRIILFCIAYQCNPWKSLPILSILSITYFTMLFWGVY